MAEGEYLGEWEKENGSPIVEFAAIGPKSYATRESDGKQDTKMKGFTLHATNAEEVNLDSMKRLIDGEMKVLTGVNLEFIKSGGEMSTMIKSKQAVFNYTKRTVVNGYNTVPNGWDAPIPDFV